MMTRALALLGMCACVSANNGGAHSVHPDQLDAHWLRAAPTPVIQQRRETDCGLAALAMVEGTWGRRATLDDLARRAPPGGDGVRLGALRDLARADGLEAFAIRATRDDLR